MCGICGIWNFERRPILDGEIGVMAATLAHRGPDGQGILCEGDLALGHRRLAILDLSPAGHQPMSYAAGRYWITYNGEIYNFLELRAELAANGYDFRSNSDTEVILAAYDAWGPKCLLRFNGMWAFAIWDRQQRALFLSRDRFGIKPLFYLIQDGRFAFASELKAFYALEGFRSEINWPVFKAELLDLHSQEGGENTLLKGVRRLRPGHYAVVSAGQVRLVRWWRTLDHLVAVPRRFDDQVLQFRELFEDACRLRMRSDVPIGTSLSGGLDSSSVVSTLAHVARQGGERLPADWQRAFIAT
ncbi:MAG: asparagine synthase (glutamine-hydrolyzing), partial [Caldilinea sp.]